jgi:hypothetical protein
VEWLQLLACQVMLVPSAAHSMGVGLNRQKCHRYLLKMIGTIAKIIVVHENDILHIIMVNSIMQGRTENKMFETIGASTIAASNKSKSDTSITKTCFQSKDE